MADITLEQGKHVYKAGQPLTALHLITQGQVLVRYPGGTYRLGKGDVIGVCEVCSEIHFLSYITAETTTILTYPLATLESLNDLLQKHPDVARLFLLSAFRQMSTILENWSVCELNCSNAYSALQTDYNRYKTLVGRYHLPVRSMDSLSSFSSFISEEIPDVWLTSYYLGLTHIYSTESYKAIIQEPSVSLGLIRKCSLDFRRTFICLEEQSRYMTTLSGFYFNDTGDDIFDFYTSLFYKLGNDCEETGELLEAIERMISDLDRFTVAGTIPFEERISAFRNRALLMDSAKASAQAADSDAEIVALLSGSLNTILEYAGPDLDIGPSFRQHIYNYRALSDRFSMDEGVCALRKVIAEEFYVLYSVLFERTLTEPSIPLPVRMFLYFGYVDEELAGIQNAVTLYKIASNMGNYSDFGMYTFYDWLLAIFSGRKAPSRNEFDMDYTDYIRKQKLSGYISDKELQSLEQNAMSKVSYELKNMFPIVNKVTFGRLTTFCPVFSSENVLKKLEDSLVTITNLSKALETVKKADFTAFYRECLDTEHFDILGKEPIHVEYIPDVILMPNLGSRGVMWQEIEGKCRTSPGRMFFSIFHLEDITTSFIRMAGEFRWELCKRVQGNRWNDVSDHSLTSDYFDYIQFYRKNHDLSTDAKERIHTSLQRAKNSFKEMFVRDYILWVMFESQGSPRLNKVARKILFNYCPFTSDLCRTLGQNPLFTELLEHRRIQVAQRLHRLDLITQKLQNNGIAIPETLEQERMYVEGTVS